MLPFSFYCTAGDRVPRFLSAPITTPPPGRQRSARLHVTTAVSPSFQMRELEEFLGVPSSRVYRVGGPRRKAIGNGSVGGRSVSVSQGRKADATLQKRTGVVPSPGLRLPAPRLPQE
jgi:hypothetical protein